MFICIYVKKVNDAAWQFHYHPGGHKKSVNDSQRSIEDRMDDEADYYHEVNMRSLHYGLTQIKEDRIENRAPTKKTIKLKLNPGAFIRKSIRNGGDKTMSTYWTYRGSLTTPGKYIRKIF